MNRDEADDKLPVFRPDEQMTNADWPKRTPDTSEALGLTDDDFKIARPAECYSDSGSEPASDSPGSGSDPGSGSGRST